MDVRWCGRNYDVLASNTQHPRVFRRQYTARWASKSWAGGRAYFDESIMAAQRNGQVVYSTQESENEGCARQIIDFARRTYLKYLTGFHDDNAITQRECFSLVVSYENRCDAETAKEQRQFDLHLFAQILVERTQCFVEKQDFRSNSKSAGDGDALLLATA